MSLIGGPMETLWQNRPLRRAAVVIVHTALWVAAFQFAISVGATRHLYVRAALVLLALRAASFLFTGLFHGIWRYAGVRELEKIVLATTAASVAALLVDTVFFAIHAPRAVYLCEWLASI